MKNAVVMFGILTLSLEGFSQTGDSIPRRDSMNMQRRAQVFAADRFAIARPLNIEFVHVAPYSYSSDKDGKSFHEGRMTGFSQLKVSSNINFVKKKNWALGATLGYRYIAAGADVFDPFTGGQKSVDNNFHYLFSSISFSYFSTLFNKRVIYTSSLAVDGSDKHLLSLTSINLVMVLWQILCSPKTFISGNILIRMPGYRWAVSSTEPLFIYTI